MSECQSSCLASPQNTTSTSRHRGRPSMEGSISRQSTTHTRDGTDGSSMDRPSDLSRQSQSAELGTIKHDQRLKLPRSGHAMKMSGAGASSTIVNPSSCQIHNGPIASRMDGRLSPVLVSTSLYIRPLAIGVGKGSRNPRETESVDVD